MKLALKLPRRNPDAPRLSLRERAAALKGSAAKVIGKPARFAPPQPVSAGKPSAALVALIDAHQLAYAGYLIARSDWAPDLDARRQAEEEAFRALLHSPLRSDADRAAYAVAVIERQSGALGDHVASGRDNPLSVAYRSLRFGEHTREPEAMRHIGLAAELKTAADPILPAIEEHRAAFAAWAPVLDVWNNTIFGTPEHDAAEAAAEEPRERERVAFSALLSTRPTTPAGLWALATYLPEAMRQSSPDTDPEALAALDALRAAALSVPQTDRGRLKLAEAAPVRVDTYDHSTGRVTYADAAGTPREGTVAEWLAFMATRLHRVARSEFSRRFDAESEGLNEAARDALDARLHRELRLDALFALAHRSDQVFAEAQAERDGIDPAALSAEKVDLKALDVMQLVHLHEAFQSARYVWEGARERRFSIKDTDPRGFVHLTAAGELADFEEDRAGRIVDRIVDEMASRTPRNEEERDRSLVLRLRHELDCEDRIRRDDLMREISQAWGA